VMIATTPTTPMTTTTTATTVAAAAATATIKRRRRRRSRRQRPRRKPSRTTADTTRPTRQLRRRQGRMVVVLEMTVGAQTQTLPPRVVRDKQRVVVHLLGHDAGRHDDGRRGTRGVGRVQIERA
jgi:hypothetical protein